MFFLFPNGNLFSVHHTHVQFLWLSSCVTDLTCMSAIPPVSTPFACWKNIYFLTPCASTLVNFSLCNILLEKVNDAMLLQVFFHAVKYWRSTAPLCTHTVLLLILYSAAWRTYTFLQRRSFRAPWCTPSATNQEAKPSQVRNNYAAILDYCVRVCKLWFVN